MKKSYLKSGGTSIETVIDKDTGEVLSVETKKHTYIAESKEEFMLIYVSLFPIFLELSSPAKSLFVYILSNYNVNTVFEIADGSRRLIAEKLNLGKSTIANALTELRNNNLIYTHSRAMHQINPRYAFKGSTRDRAKALKAIIEVEYNKK